METKDILKSDVLDILFEGRNKEYGAYELRKNYQKRLRNSIIACLSLVAVLLSFQMVAAFLSH